MDKWGCLFGITDVEDTRFDVDVFQKTDQDAAVSFL